ncbi:MAG: hypothetical protein LBP81_02720 [Treponema sp.]|jgi:hypothetical protein|nr:hypothetical protein [Treponema sp.]
MEHNVNLEVLSTREGFNSAVRHIKKTLGIIEALEGNANLGDVLFELEDREFTGDRIGLLLRMILIDKLKYTALSFNPASVAAEPAALAEEFEKWKAVDLVAVYHHPDRGLLAANPKVPEELAAFGVLRKRELLVIYAGRADAPADGICQKAAEIAAALFSGGKPRIPRELYAGNYGVKKPGMKGAEKSRRVTPAASGGPAGMTPLYSVVVQNELFHNGNVEAWKRIIAAYTARYPELQVHIYYEGERILDINALFKWGKVKHGRAIQFSVLGREIRDTAKLRRYLIQGAGHQFEAFLQGPPGRVMKLF